MNETLRDKDKKKRKKEDKERWLMSQHVPVCLFTCFFVTKIFHRQNGGMTSHENINLMSQADQISGENLYK